MSNRAFLIGGNDSDPPGIVANGVNYDPDTEILAGASNALPILWSSLFFDGNLMHHHVQECRIPTLVARRCDALKILSVRIPCIKEAFPHCSPAIENWKCLVEEAQFEYVKVDTLEVWMLDEDGFECRLRSAMRWYDTSDETDLQALASLADTTYDFIHRRIVVPDGFVADYCMHGYQWVREVPWPEQ